MDPATLKLAKKKYPVFQCTFTDCSEHGDRAQVTMVRHVLRKHTANVKVPFQCSICDFVPMSEKELIKHTKWNLPHKSQGQGTFEIIKGREPMSISELNLKKWENAASVTFWSNKLQEKKRTVGKSDVKLCSVENREIEPVVEERIEDIRNQLLGLGDEDYETKKQLRRMANQRKIVHAYLRKRKSWMSS